MNSMLRDLLYITLLKKLIHVRIRDVLRTQASLLESRSNRSASNPKWSHHSVYRVGKPQDIWWQASHSIRCGKRCEIFGVILAKAINQSARAEVEDELVGLLVRCEKSLSVVGTIGPLPALDNVLAECCRSLVTDTHTTSRHFARNSSGSRRPSRS